MALADWGRRLEPLEVPFSRAIRETDLPPLPGKFWERLADIEQEVETRIAERQGLAYKSDPFKVRFGELLPEEREGLMDELWSLMGGPYLTQPISAGQYAREALGPKMVRPVINELGELERSPYGIMPTVTEDLLKRDVDPRMLFWNQVSVGYLHGPLGMGQGIGEHYRVMRPPTMKALQSSEDVLRRYIDQPGNVLIYDIESAGLQQETGLWQIAAQLMSPEGETIANRTFHFRNPWMESLGEIGPSRQSVADFVLQDVESLDSPEALSEFFAMAKEAQYIGGHNVLSFDYGMLKHFVEGSNAYQAGGDYATAANEFFNRFYNPETGEVGKDVIDTLMLSRRMLSENIRGAEELGITESPQFFSMQNLVLESDLLKRLEESKGTQYVDDLLKKGMHFADVDVPIEAQLFFSLVQQARGEGGLDLAASLEGEWRGRAIRSKAIGPTIEMTDFTRHVNDRMVEPLLRASTGPRPALYFDPAAWGGRFNSVQDLLDQGITTKAALEKEGLTQHIRRVRLTPLEQQAHMSRNFETTLSERPFYVEGASFRTQMGDLWRNKNQIGRRLREAFWSGPSAPERSANELAFQAGIWNRISEPFTEGGLLRTDVALPTGAEWTAIQRQLSEKGIPFSNLSLVERHLMSTLYGAAPESMDPAMQNLQSIFGRDIMPVMDIVGSKGVGVVGSQKIPTIPQWMLAEAEKANVFDIVGADGATRTHFNTEITPQAYQVSPFRYMQQSKDVGYEVGFMFRFAEGEQGAEERKRLLEFFESKIGEEGYESLQDVTKEGEPVMGALARSLGIMGDATTVAENTAANIYGVQIGTLTGFGDKQAAKQMHDVLRQITGNNVERSNIEANVFGVGSEEGATRVAGLALRPEFMSKEQLEKMGYQARQSARIADEAMNLAKNDTLMGLFDVLSKSKDSTNIMKWINGFTSIRKKAPLLLLAGATMGGGYYLHRRKRADRIYDQTFEFQPPEDQTWYADSKREIDKGYIPVTKPQPGGQDFIPNPLDTTDIVHQLDQRKIAHSYMGSQKYGYLFNPNNGL